jgi:hypothetical protein
METRSAQGQEQSVARRDAHGVQPSRKSVARMRQVGRPHDDRTGLHSHLACYLHISTKESTREREQTIKKQKFIKIRGSTPGVRIFFANETKKE